MIRTITKQAFAKACGTSRPTLNKWIKDNKDGIREYVTPDGIDASIFDVEPWASLRQDQPPVDQDQDELLTIRQELATLKAENAVLQERISGLTQLNDAQQREIERLTQLADQAQRLQLAQLTALPAPRKTFREWIDGIFGKKQDAPADDQPTV